jgi:hypothetical protein
MQSAVFVRSLGFHRADERSEGRSARGMGFKERLRLERWLRIIGELLSNHWCVKCQTRVYTGVYCPSNCPFLARYCMIVPSLSWQIVVYPITVTTIHIAFQWKFKKESAILRMYCRRFALQYPHRLRLLHAVVCQRRRNPWLQCALGWEQPILARCGMTTTPFLACPQCLSYGTPR